LSKVILETFASQQQKNLFMDIVGKQNKQFSKNPKLEILQQFYD